MGPLLDSEAAQLVNCVVLYMVQQHCMELGMDKHPVCNKA